MCKCDALSLIGDLPVGNLRQLLFMVFEDLGEILCWYVIFSPFYFFSFFLILIRSGFEFVMRLLNQMSDA